MNGKRAKALRREARERCVGLPDRSYRRRNPNQDGKGGGFHVLSDCQRGIYQLLKAGRADAG